MKILLVDDDPGVRKLVQAGLRKMGFDISLATSGHEGLEALGRNDFSVMILDLRMPEETGDGLYVLERYRDVSPGTAVIVLTAHGSEDRAIMALRSGARNYLKKPVSLQKLADAIREAGVIPCGDFVIDTARRMVTHVPSGKPVSLYPTTYAILELLVRYDGAFSYQEIAQKIYGEELSPEAARNRLRTHMSNLNKALRAYVHGDFIIKSPAGYMIAA